MIVGVVQARMSSRRCPGKVLARLAGKPILAYLLERLDRCERLNDVIVATSVEADDDAVEEFCRQRNTRCYRGSLLNVASRFVDIMEANSADGYVRVNADSPFMDPAVVDDLIAVYERSTPDLVTNVLPRSFPKGVSAEVIEPQRYLDVYPCFTSQGDFEHVTTYYYSHREQFNIVNVSSPEARSDESLTVDDPADLDLFEQVVRRMDRPHWEYGWKEVLELRDVHDVRG